MGDSESVIRTQRRKKETVIERFGGKCCICGYNKCINALEFHHLDPNNKKESPSYVVMRWSFERAKKELDKCILICSNCHREIHYSNKNTDFQIYRKSWISKKCPQCKEIFETKNYEQKYCCEPCARVADRKVIRPCKNELQKLLEQKVPWTTLGKMFGVSDNAVRKWAKKYNII